MRTYDVIVVGARPAGAATAMLLARQGLRVLLLDRARYALRDAQVLARSLAETGGAGELGRALGRFASDRDRAVTGLFDVADRIGGYGWDLPQVRGHLFDLSSAMSRELELITNAATSVEDAAT
jgi:2-polyprenyl-6-methoxyphenol hydroxylase-like FAD-dependent oxidoreductase